MNKHLSSMTAFTRQTHREKWGSLIWELKSVNHRYCDINARLPEMLRHTEIKVRSMISTYLHRGKIEAILIFQPNEETSFDYLLNSHALNHLAHLNDKIQAVIPHAVINVFDVLKWPGILQSEQKNIEQIENVQFELLRLSLEDLIATREREGEQLRFFLREQLQQMKDKMNIISKTIPTMLDEFRKKMVNRLEILKSEIDENRLEQEMVIWIQKTDITEELQRLTAHVREVERVLDEGGLVGRRLDFLMQELYRETNTIASKSVDVAISQTAIDLKVIIEQMREQVQNIE